MARLVSLDGGRVCIISAASESVIGAAALNRKNVVWGAGDKVEIEARTSEDRAAS